MFSISQNRRLYIVVIGAILLSLLWIIVTRGDSKEGVVVDLVDGSGLYQISEYLHREDIIRFPLIFRMTAIILGGERKVKAGQYYFEKSTNSISAAERVIRGDYRIETVKLTIPEGFNVKKISNLFTEEKFLYFDNDLFETVASEGYLFPDTYFIPITATASSTIKLLQSNFTKKVSTLVSEVELSGHSLEDIIIMASLLEAEVKTKEDMEIASSILWKRLGLGMPLQVDAYKWTYEFKGLPERPINNPGLISIGAALHPTSTPYLYFLTDKDGKAHYARTFDEHKTNIAKYLR